MTRCGQMKSMRTVLRASLALATFPVWVVGPSGTRPAVAQETHPLSRSVTVTSDPPGATIWMKEGTTLTCTNTLTPGAVELKFHDQNDLKKVRLRRFGYRGQDLDIKFTDDKVNAALGDPAPDSFVVTDDRGPELKQLSAGLQKEFKKGIFADPEAFRCAPFDLDFVHVMGEKGALTLGVVLAADRDFGGAALRLASHAGTRDERRQKMTQAVLDGGVAEVLGRLRGPAAKFPNLKVITVVFSRSATVTTPTLETVVTQAEAHLVVVPKDYSHPTGLEYVTPGPVEHTVVVDKEEAVVRNIKIAMSVDKIPDTVDKKAITDAVVATGEIDLGDERGSRHITPTTLDKILDAAEDGDLGVVNALLRDHPDLAFSKDTEGQTPLHWAAAKNHKDVAELLLANKAEVSAQDDDGWTPLLLAAYEADRGLVELLLAKGADVNARGHNGGTPLELAALSGHRDKVELLLAKGADIKTRDNFGNTPLHAAAFSGNTVVAELLLAKGADVNAKNDDGATPADRAFHEGESHKAMVDLLLEHGGSYAVEAEKLRNDLDRRNYAERVQEGVVEKIGKARVDRLKLHYSVAGPDSTYLVYHSFGVTAHVCENMLATPGFVSGLRNLGFTTLVCTDDGASTFTFDLAQ